MPHLLSAPTTVNLELTEICNVKCDHCYNYWRDESMGEISLDGERLERVIDNLAKAGVFHVILSGGEPMAKFPLLLQAVERLNSHGMSLSVNSNVMLLTPERASQLVERGVDHILTSLPSLDPATNDRIMNKVGAFEKIVTGITNAVDAGIRISVNMVITKKNYQDVYKTAKFVANLGAQRIFITRSVPPIYTETVSDDEYDMTPEEVRSALDSAIQARDEFGIMIGTLVSYPLCFLSDLEKYKDFVGRGCPAQRGDRMSINANGAVHACVHEEDGYGNILENDIRDIYQNSMRKWHGGNLHYDGCEGCEYIDVCESGCRMNALGREGAMNLKDPLYQGPTHFKRHFKFDQNDDSITLIEENQAFTVPSRLRFRKENDFYLVNIRWGNSITLDNETTEFLIAHQESGEAFTLNDLGETKAKILRNLYFKDVIETKDSQPTDSNKAFLGLSLNPDALKTGT